MTQAKIVLKQGTGEELARSLEFYDILTQAAGHDAFFADLVRQTHVLDFGTKGLRDLEKAWNPEQYTQGLFSGKIYSSLLLPQPNTKLDFAFFSEGRPCGFSLTVDTQDPSRWFLSIINNNAAPLEQQNFTVLCSNTLNAPFKNTSEVPDLQEAIGKSLQNVPQIQQLLLNNFPFDENNQADLAKLKKLEAKIQEQCYTAARNAFIHLAQNEEHPLFQVAKQLLTEFPEEHQANKDLTTVLYVAKKTIDESNDLQKTLFNIEKWNALASTRDFPAGSFATSVLQPHFRTALKSFQERMDTNQAHPLHALGRKLLEAVSNEQAPDIHTLNRILTVQKIWENFGSGQNILIQHLKELRELSNALEPSSEIGKALFPLMNQTYQFLIREELALFQSEVEVLPYQEQALALARIIKQKNQQSPSPEALEALQVIKKTLQELENTEKTAANLKKLDALLLKTSDVDIRTALETCMNAFCKDAFQTELINFKQILAANKEHPLYEEGLKFAEALSLDHQQNYLCLEILRHIVQGAHFNTLNPILDRISDKTNEASKILSARFMVYLEQDHKRFLYKDEVKRFTELQEQNYNGPLKQAAEALGKAAMDLHSAKILHLAHKTVKEIADPKKTAINTKALELLAQDTAQLQNNPRSKIIGERLLMLAGAATVLGLLAAAPVSGSLLVITGVCLLVAKICLMAIGGTALGAGLSGAGFFYRGAKQHAQNNAIIQAAGGLAQAAAAQRPKTSGEKAKQEAAGTAPAPSAQAPKSVEPDTSKATSKAKKQLKNMTVVSDLYDDDPTPPPSRPGSQG